MESFTPKTGNPIPMTNENIIDFVRSRNHPSKHLDLFPDDIECIKRTGYGRVNLDKKTYTFDVIHEQDVDILRVMVGDPIINSALPVVNTFVIDPSKAYSLWTMSQQDNVHVYISILEVPNNLVSATAWALGLTARNRVSPNQMISLYHANQEEYERKHYLNPNLPATAYKPCIRKFTDWLAGTWTADRNGNHLNAKVTWATDVTIEPTYNEAINTLDSISDIVSTVSAKSRINFVKDVLQSRKNNTGES